jgi:tRNA dimethylallyltransferase
MKKVVVIVGPTGSGKTKLSIELSKHFHAEIINGDSVQVYEGLNIGSAKIKEHEKKGIPHHLLSHVPPSQMYTVFEFQQEARKKIHEIDQPMIVGGTGLYIKAALYDYRFLSEKSTHPKYDDVKTETLYEWLIQKQPNHPVDSNNRRRIIRALELAEHNIDPLSHQLKHHALYDVCLIYLNVDRTELKHTLIKRLQQQVDEGFIEEVKSLFEMGIEKNSIGYREWLLYLKQELTYDEAFDTIIKKTMALAKKQKTWFLNQMTPHVLEATSKTLYEDAKSMIEAFYES